MSDNKYWHSFSELTDNERLQKITKDEFQEELPFGDFDDKGLLDSKTPRRDFLKYLGFSTAAATLAASCKTPVRKAIPYVNKPENVVPGVAKYYATTFVQNGEVVPVLAKVRDGRPIKIEGNNLSTLTQGGTSARVQASVLDLYDTHRLTHPKKNKGNGTFDEIPTFEQLDTQVANALAGLGGAPVVLLTSTVVSPSTRQLITEFLGKYPGSRHVQYDAYSYSGLIQANGGRVPSYQFDKAKVIVSLGADFLGTWLSPVEQAKQYSLNRKINEANPTMSKHYQFESHLSMTGSNADERYTHRPSEAGQVALALLAAVGGGGAAVNFGDAKLAKGIQKAAGDLKAAGGAALVVSGSNDANVQAVVAAINAAIGANGNTINSGVANYTKQGLDADMVTLVNAMDAGQIGALLIYDANPAYDYFDSARFANAMKKVKLSVSFNTKLDETTKLCQYSIPTHHYLESWGDAEPRAGYISFIQPTINPLFKTRPFQTSLLKWSGNNTDWETYFRNYWTGKLGGGHQFNLALQDGVLENTTAATGGTTSTTAAPATASAVAALSAAKSSGKNELVIYQNVAVGSGKQSGNPWLLELPDPVTKVTWGNFAMVSVSKAKELGIVLDTDYEYYQDKPLIDISVNNKKVTLPVMVVPGMHADTIAVAVGYGRNPEFGVASKDLGANVYPFARWNGANVDYYTEVNVSKAAGSDKVAQQQIHSSYEGRTQVVKETTLATLLKYPHRYTEEREELIKDFAPKTGDYRNEATLFSKSSDTIPGGIRIGDHVQSGLKWGMSIDLNSCIGCGACVVACHLENNVPVVGKNEVLRAHEMHWLRIDRYFVSDEKNPDDLKAVVFQPMLCQHCDNAPCENVCPVAATMHSSEGINQMAYNRCIGTRYCANNCPYKVRRFNWGDYTGASTHGVMGPDSGVGTLNEVVHDMNDELTRMVLNPDVVTRSRGVMEKCTFCVQRTQGGKLKAKQENRPLTGDEVQSACAQACPTNAITFGNVNDKSSTVAQIRKNNPGRLFYVIEQIHTLPNVSYLAKVRNSEEITFVENTVEGGEHARQEEKRGAVNSNETQKETH